MARDLHVLAPDRLASQWIDVCYSLSRECSAVGLGQSLRSRHLALRVHRALKRPPWKPDDAA